MTRATQATRREFLRQTATATAGALAAPYVISATSLGDEKKGDEKKVAANSRIAVGAIGSGNMGMGDIRCARQSLADLVS